MKEQKKRKLKSGTIIQNGRLMKIVQVECRGVTRDYQYKLLETRPLLVITPLSWVIYKGVITKTGYYIDEQGNANVKRDDGSQFFTLRGPAGTGKTESFKDLMWYMGVNFYNVCCLDEMKPDNFSQILKAANPGQSVCLDEFNRVGTDCQKQFAVDVQQMVKKDTSMLMATFNPGYMGRDPLCEELRQCITNIADTTVPDTEIIVDNMLMNNGFSSFNTLSSKIVQITRYFRDTLPKKRYFDFGIRPIRTCVIIAGTVLKSGEDEDFAVAVALRNVWVRSMPTQCQDQYLSYVALIIMGASQTKLMQLKNYTSSNYMSIINSPYLGLMETLEFRHGVRLVTGNGGFEAAQDLLTFFKNLDVYETRVYCFEIPPYSDNAEEFNNSAYGYFDGKQWVDGFFTQILRDGLAAQDIKHYIVIHGELHPALIENLNTVLDDNKHLYLANGQKVAFGSNMRVIFVGPEASSNFTSPAFASRLGTVNIE